MSPTHSESGILNTMVSRSGRDVGGIIGGSSVIVNIAVN